MNNLDEIYKLPKLTQEEIDNIHNMKSFVSIKEIKILVQNPPIKKTPGPGCFAVEYQNVREIKV